MASTSDDEFGFNSDEEADLLALSAEPTNLHTTRKRDTGDEDLPQAKRQALTSTANEEASRAASVADQTLHAFFGLPGFRLKQRTVISRILDGGSAVVVFPTGT